MSRKAKRPKKTQPPSSTTEDTHLTDDVQNGPAGSPLNVLHASPLHRQTNRNHGVGTDVSAADSRGDDYGLEENAANDWTDEQLLDLLRCWAGHEAGKAPSEVTLDDIRLQATMLVSGLPVNYWPSELADYEDEHGNLHTTIATQIRRVIGGRDDA